MFPPELDPKRGRRSAAPVRRIGRRGRPVSLVAAVLLCTAFWAVSAGMALWGIAHDNAGGTGGNVAGVAFWTVAVAILLWRVWRGGRKAIGFVSGIGTLLGIVFLLGMAAFIVLIVVAPPGGSVLTSAAYLLPGLIAGCALLAAGILLRRPEVAEWGGF